MRLVKDVKLYDKIVDRLNDRMPYAEYDGTIINLLEGTDAIIFGGAVRDSIAELPINDIDILALSQSFNMIRERVPMNLAQTAEEYAKLKLANTHYFTVYEDSSRTIQVIAPSTYMILTNETDAKIFVSNIISNVDLSNCGVAIMPQKHPGYIIESVVGAIEDIQNMEYRLTNGSMTTDRIQYRLDKMNRRGWKNKFIKNDIIVWDMHRRRQVEETIVQISFDELVDSRTISNINMAAYRALTGKVNYFH